MFSQEKKWLPLITLTAFFRLIFWLIHQRLGPGLIRDPMKQNSSNEIIRLTAFGGVKIRSICTSEDLAGLEFDSGFSAATENKSLFKGSESIKLQAKQPDANLVLAISGDDLIIGFAILAYPEPGERWIRLGPGIMMEVKAIEVVRRCRSAGIARGMLKMALDLPRIEDRIIYMVGYSWTWDLHGARMTAAQYRQMLTKLFKRHGFEQYQTNEPNICLKPENLFMCRIGQNISPVIIDRFKWLRFGLSPWTWM
jgi:acetoin utilization protein AcuA